MDTQKERHPTAFWLSASLTAHALAALCIALLMRTGGDGTESRSGARDGHADTQSYTAIEITRPSPHARPGMGKATPITAQAPTHGSAQPTFDLSQAGFGIPALSDDSSTLPPQTDDSGPNPPAMPAIGMLTPGDARFLSFYSRLYDKVEMNWHNEWRRLYTRLPLLNLSRSQYIAIVEFEFNEQGDIVETKLLQSSGVRDLDVAAMQAIIGARNAPNPPLAMFQGPDKHNRLVYSFNYNFSRY